MKPLILVTNDDGIESPGLAAAVEVAIALGEVIVAAPIDQQTSTGRGYAKTPTTGRIFRHDRFKAREVLGAFGIEGTPATAVSHALLELVPRRPDLCISGINYGENVGLSIAASGTVGAALEADTYDVPSMAISLECPVAEQKSSEFSSKTWGASVDIGRRIAQRLLKEGLPKRIAVWNVNIPSDATESTAIHFVKQSRLNYFEFLVPKRSSLAEPVRLHAEIRLPKPLNDPGTDIEALVVRRVVSICELTWDQSSLARTGPF
ncbi:MAG: 5'/3'-nucleotidase SurE [Rhizomicrobium sp.]